MPQNGQPQPSENDLNPWRITPDEVALGMGIFILVYAIGVGRLVWNEGFLNTKDAWRETFHAIAGGMAETSWPGPGRPCSQSWERRSSGPWRCASRVLEEPCQRGLHPRETEDRP